MPSVYQLKPRFQALLRPLMRALARAHVTPNGLTLIAVAGSIAVGVTVGLLGDRPGSLLLLPAWLLARMALNALDGMMARELHMATRLGAALNEVGDVVSDIALYLPLATLPRADLWSVVMFTLLAGLSEFCGLLGIVLGGQRQYAGPMGKSDRAFVVGALALVTALVPTARPVWRWVFWVGAVLGAITCLNRLRGALAVPPSAGASAMPPTPPRAAS